MSRHLAAPLSAISLPRYGGMVHRIFSLLMGYKMSKARVRGEGVAQMWRECGGGVLWRKRHGVPGGLLNFGKKLTVSKVSQPYVDQRGGHTTKYH